MAGGARPGLSVDRADRRCHQPRVARFTEHDTTEENLRTFGEWLRRYGRPLAHYTDKNSIFRTAGPAAVAEQLRGEEGARSQFGRALRELGIKWIAAKSPQANICITLQSMWVTAKAWRYVAHDPLGGVVLPDIRRVQRFFFSQ